MTFYICLSLPPLTADCAVCSDGYAESLSYTCSSCSDRKASVMAMVALPITVVLCVAFLGYMVSKEREAWPAGRLHWLKRLLPLQSLKIMIVVWQILTEVSQHRKGSRSCRLMNYLTGFAQVCDIELINLNVINVLVQARSVVLHIPPHVHASQVP